MDIFQKMAGAPYFTSSSFWQIRVVEESSKLLTFNSSCGRFRFLHIPYGIHSANEACQARIAAIIESIEGYRNAQDVIITTELLEKRIIEVLQVVRRSGLKLNRAKSQFNQRQLTFLGHTISNKGIAPDTRKIKSITDMHQLINQRLLRHAYIPGKISPKPLNQNSTLVSSEEALFGPQREALQDLKKMITQSPTLKYFDPKLPVKVSSDISAQGLGALLEQMHENERDPIAYASRSLISAETNYCPLELEIQSILFAGQYFPEYIYGPN